MSNIALINVYYNLFYLKLLFLFKVAICDLEDNFFIIYEIIFFTPDIICMVDTYLETQGLQITLIRLTKLGL